MSKPKRNRKRVKMVLPIRVWGTDESGKPFVCLAHTLDVTPNGARIGGFSAPVKPGERVGITRGMKKAHFRVAWVGIKGSPTEEQIGVELVESQKDIWGLQLPTPERDDFTAMERRAIASAAAAPADATTSGKSAEFPQVVEKLGKVASDLRRIETQLQGASLHPAIASEFQAASSHLRNSSAVVERWISERGSAEDPFPLLVLLNTHRVMAASLVCDALARDLSTVRAMIPKHLMENLLQNVGNLFAQVANYEVEVDPVANVAEADAATEVSSGTDMSREEQATDIGELGEFPLSRR